MINYKRFKLLEGGIVATLLSLPTVSAYSGGLPIMDLWTVFVENIFGGFWISVVGLMAVMMLILMMGSISAFTAVNFVLIFFMAMAMGYGHPLVTIPLFIGIMSWSLFQIYKFINSSAQ